MSDKAIIKSSESVVCFLDILGFSDMVEADFLGTTSSYAHRVKSFLAPLSTEAREAAVELVQFSDSIVVAATWSTESALNLIRFCARLQWLGLTSRLLLRGAISIGSHCSEPGFMFSQGLVAAYRLESKAARYPRILVDNNLIELMKYHGSSTEVGAFLATSCAVDADGAIFVDFFESSKTEDLLVAVRDLLVTADFNVPGVLEKYEWLQRYADFSCDKSGTGRISFGLPRMRRLTERL